MAENKTQRTGASIEKFRTSLENKRRHEDGFTILKEVAGLEPEMWWPLPMGFDSYSYKYESGKEGDIFLTGFSRRKQSLLLYSIDGFDGCDDLLTRLGKNRKRASCLYIDKLADVNINVLRELVQRLLEHLNSNSQS